VRSLRRRDLIARFEESARLQSGQLDSYARFGAYWEIDTDPSKLTAPNALPCTAATAHELVKLPTPLSDLRETQSKQLINWGYAICDQCTRTHYKDQSLEGKPSPNWPFCEVPLM
jgi:NTE family protein